MASGGALASWLPRIPETRAKLGLSYDELGLALFGAGGGAMLFMPITGWLIGRWGSYWITRVTAVASGFQRTRTFEKLGLNEAMCSPKASPYSKSKIF